jgi:hypothetical protein
MMLRYQINSAHRANILLDSAFQNFDSLQVNTRKSFLRYLTVGPLN